jgi:hypothetical protein
MPKGKVNIPRARKTVDKGAKSAAMCAVDLLTPGQRALATAFLSDPVPPTPPQRINRETQRRMTKEQKKQEKKNTKKYGAPYRTSDQVIRIPRTMWSEEKGHVVLCDEDGTEVPPVSPATSIINQLDHD